MLSVQTAGTSIGAVMGLGEVAGNEVLSMFECLMEHKARTDRSLANRHLRGATMVLCDITSSYFEGKQLFPRAVRFGHGRDSGKDRKQMVFGRGLSRE